MKSLNYRVLLLFALLLLVTGVISAQAQQLDITLPTGFTQTEITSLLDRPTTMRFAPDGRLFIAQQGGAVRVVVNDVLLPDPVITVNTLNKNEAGLVGLTLDPEFETNGYLYLYYTVPGDDTTAPHNRVSRFTLTGNIADPSSEFIVFDLDDLVASKPGDETRHMGGSMNFGADSKLYIGVGDNFNSANAQSLENVKGKILRINSNGSIPEDNPFYDELEGNNRAIWALGLRNPFSLGIQPGTGKILFNDVGEETWEEINEGVAGANYGWPIVEGPIDEAVPVPPAPENYVDPIYALHHPATGCISFVGAAFYNPVTVQFPEEYVGDYFYGEFCADWIESYDLETGKSTRFLSAGSLNPAPTDVQISPDGALYYSGLFGKLFKITYSDEPIPTPTPTTEVPSTNLIVNGGFEAQDASNNRVIAPWSGKNMVKDKIKCNKPDKQVSRSDECAFQFKGVQAYNASLKQSVDTTDLNLNDTLTFRAWVRSTDIGAQTSTAVLTVKFPTLPKAKVELIAEPNTAIYTELVGDAVVLEELPSKIKVQLRSKSTTGKLLVDDVALNVNEASGLLSLPQMP